MLLISYANYITLISSHFTMTYVYVQLFLESGFVPLSGGGRIHPTFMRIFWSACFLQGGCPSLPPTSRLRHEWFFYLIHRWDPGRFYCSGPEQTWEWWILRSNSTFFKTPELSNQSLSSGCSFKSYPGLSHAMKTTFYKSIYTNQ